MVSYRRGAASSGSSQDITPDGVFQMQTLDITDTILWLLPDPAWTSATILNSGNEGIYVIVNTTDTSDPILLERGQSLAVDMVVKGKLTRLGLWCDAGLTSQAKLISKR